MNKNGGESRYPKQKV